ncbi:hypothetical protein [Cognatishimia sp. F0-27]|uniref:hypothetical protein n=1 Tax=Cognatishimia sp. F0-27 TaxID=2816855 RepID=UPI001D0C0CDB|nr:hypothetical protein [Cognatishimia sp. F0-27]MCC1492243.1 hypothetical protein [Cognatishimia sp. F0-27]
MTALKDFQRLEASALWRASVESQRREVIVSLGDATLTISDPQGRVLTHWSLGAVTRATKVPALYHPDTDPAQTLEIPADETAMINGLDRVLRAIDRKRPKPGKLRLLLGVATAAALMGLATLWLPNALERTATRVVPDVKRSEIGAALLSRVSRVTGAPCTARDAQAPLGRLAARLLGEARRDALVVLPDGIAESAHLPGGIVLLNRSVFEDFEDPDVAAGFIIVETVRAEETDPLADLLDHAGLVPTLRLLTTGALPDEALDRYAEHLLSASPGDPEPARLLDAFAAAGLRSTPYARARDITGETVLPLIEGDPRAGGASRLVVSDSDWVRLQGICGA